MRWKVCTIQSEAVLVCKAGMITPLGCTPRFHACFAKASTQDLSGFVIYRGIPLLFYQRRWLEVVWSVV